MTSVLWPYNGAAAPPPPDTGGFTPSFPGEPHPDVAPIVGTSTPSNNQSPHDQPMITRRFWNGESANGVGNNMSNVIAADHAQGAIPWVSNRPDDPWDEVASGSMTWGNGPHDTNIDTLLDTFVANDSLPVWLTLEHEPENDGDTSAQGKSPEDYAAMMSRIRWRQEVRGDCTHVAIAPILTAYSSLYDDDDDTHFRDPDRWITFDNTCRNPSGTQYLIGGNPIQLYHMIGVDSYGGDGAQWGPTAPSRHQRVVSRLEHARKYGLRLANAETGTRVQDTTVLDSIWDLSVIRDELDLVAVTWWDNGDFVLTGNKLTYYEAALAAARAREAAL